MTPGCEPSDAVDDRAVTDEMGWAHVSMFKAGCPCKCWEGHAVCPDGPSGFAAPTPISYRLVGHNLENGFGLAALDGQGSEKEPSESAGTPSPRD